MIPEMKSYREEVLHPAASVILVKNIDEAIEIANNSDFWLCGCFYGDDVEELKVDCSSDRDGYSILNKPAGSQAHLPFGGVKLLGYGKENGPEGLRVFMNKEVIVY